MIYYKYEEVIQFLSKKGGIKMNENKFNEIFKQSVQNYHRMSFFNDEERIDICNDILDDFEIEFHQYRKGIDSPLRYPRLLKRYGKNIIRVDKFTTSDNFRIYIEVFLDTYMYIHHPYIFEE